MVILSDVHPDDSALSIGRNRPAVEGHFIRRGTMFRWSLDSAGVQHLLLPPTENPAQLSGVHVRVDLPFSATCRVVVLPADAAFRPFREELGRDGAGAN